MVLSRNNKDANSYHENEKSTFRAKLQACRESINELNILLADRLEELQDLREKLHISETQKMKLRERLRRLGKSAACNRKRTANHRLRH